MIKSTINGLKDRLVDFIFHREDPFSALDGKVLASLKNKNSTNLKISHVATDLLNSLENNESLKLNAKRFLSLCAKKRRIKESDLPALRALDIKLQEAENPFLLATTRNEFKRWQRWGFNKEVFVNFNTFAQFVLNSPLGNQMKIFNNAISMKEGIPGLLVGGDWKSHEEVMNQFEVKFLSEFNEKFMIHKETKKVYTYLDNGKGLQKHNPYTETTLRCPITRLTEEEFERTLEVAKKFVRKGEEELGAEPNKDRTFIYQIVTSYIDKGPSTNMTELCYRRKKNN